MNFDQSAQARAQVESLDSLGKSKTDHFLSRDFWNAPLRNFAQATGLTISLYSSEGLCLSGPHEGSPLSQRFSKTGFWADGGLGLENERALGMLAMDSGDVEFQISLKGLGLAGFALSIQERVVGFLIIGWVPDRFVDPMTSDYIAKSAHLLPMEVWRLIRMQPPMTKEKVHLYASLLKTFATTFIDQLEKQWEEKQYNRTLNVINECGAALTVARTIPEIASTVIQSVLEIVEAEDVKVSIFAESSEGEKFTQQSSPGGNSADDSEQEVEKRSLIIPIKSAPNAVLGAIEIRMSVEDSGTEFLERISTLTNQVAVAIQKVRLIEDLEKEQELLKSANSELAHLSKIKDEFLATLSHELRTPMNAILGWAQLLRDKEVGPDDLSYAMAAVERNARIQSHLIEDLLDISRIVSGKMVLSREEIDIQKILFEAIETVKPAADAKKIAIHFQGTSSDVQILGDSTRLQQVFWNLLSNAVKFTPEKGSVWVGLENVGSYLKIELIDSGKGISQEFLPHLFNRFSQADGSSTRLYGGLGLGLAIVRHLVELHGGTIQAFSDGEGKGSRFVLFLPQGASERALLGNQELKKKLASLSDSTRKELNGYRVLVVDDEADSLRLIQFILEKIGASVRGVSNAKDAYAEFRSWRPDLIISDISMPEESGYELIKKIRLLSPLEGGATPAIALTAFAGIESAKEATDAGFQRHFDKPLNFEILLDALREMGFKRA